MRGVDEPYMNNSMINSFYEIYSDKNNLSSYKNYYNALRLWVKKNENKLRSRLQHDYRLRMLIDLDVDKYLVDNPEILLEDEKKRMSRINFSNINTMLMIICDTMWDMVTIRSNKNCPCCGDGDLRYIRVSLNNGSHEAVLLECNICGRLANMDGSRYEGERIDRYYPVCKDEMTKVLYGEK